MIGCTIVTAVKTAICSSLFAQCNYFTYHAEVSYNGTSTPPSFTFSFITCVDVGDFRLTPITGTSYQPGNPPSANFTINTTAEGDTTFQLQIHGETMISRIHSTTPVIIQRTVNVTVIDGMLCYEIERKSIFVSP